jgi:hypothetical protein
MRGKAALEFAAHGLRCRIVLPLRG